MNKKALLHYHLFKNAGTSLDTTLKKNFSEDTGEWITKEFPANIPANREQAKDWITENKQAKCFSSHTICFPVPKIEDVELFPVIFLRHPIDRIASAYNFEKKQTTPNFGACVARNTNFAGYVEIRTSQVHDTQCSNFQAARLATMFNGPASLEDKATRALKELPFVGTVENYEKSLRHLESKLQEWGLDVKLVNVIENAERAGIALEDKLISIKKELGADLYGILEEKNALDIQLWEEASKIYK